MSQERISASSLGHAAGGRNLFSGLDLQAGSGECVAIEGPNGSGKTTLLRILAGLIDPDEGSVERVDGLQLCYLGHRLGLSGLLSPLENLLALAALRERPPRLPLAEALERCGASEDRPCRELSAGQRQRAALAMLAAFPADLWLLDEPQAGLDDSGKLLLGELLEEHLASMGAAVISSHSWDSLPEHAHCVRLGG